MIDVDKAIAFILKDDVANTDIVTLGTEACAILGQSDDQVIPARNGFNNALVNELEALASLKILPKLGEQFTFDCRAALSNYDGYEFENSNGDELTKDDGCIILDMGDSDVLLMLDGDPRSVYLLYHDEGGPIEFCNINEFIHLAFVSAMIEGNEVLFEAVDKALEKGEYRKQRFLIGVMMDEVHKGFSY